MLLPKLQLAVVGAVVAAGAAIVLGVRHFRGREEEDQSTKHKIKRKVGCCSILKCCSKALYRV